MVAIRALYHAILEDKITILCLAPTQRQSGILFRKIKSFINSNSQLYRESKTPVDINSLVKRDTLTAIEFNNGSIIHSLPATGSGENIRGFSASVIIIDEAAFIEDEIYAAITPMLLTTGGALILISSPNGVNNFFYKAYSDSLFGFKSFHFTSYENPLADMDLLQSEKDTKPDVTFRQEYLGEFIESVGSMFTVAEIEACMKSDIPIRESPIPGCDYYFGYDPARFGDDLAAGIIIEDRRRFNYSIPFIIVNAIEMTKKNTS